MIDIFFITPLIVAILLTVVLTPFSILIAKRFGLIDDPTKRNHPALLHKSPIPRAGGFGIYISILVTVLIFIPMSPTILSILIAGALVVIVGLLDDKYDISPYTRFGTNILAALIVVLSGVTIPFVTNPFGGILMFDSFSIPLLFFSLTIGDILAVIWIVWVMNMLNWSKGVDGQMPGIAVISALVIGIASLRFDFLNQENIQSAMMAFIVAGSALGFLFYNFYPAKIFPGYSATILGFMIGVLSIVSGVKLATAILVMGVPTVDAGVTIIRRIMAGKSPFWHDRQHLHHLLLKLGYGHRSIAIFYWTMSAVLGIIALNLSSKGKLFAIILVVVTVIGVILALRTAVRDRNE